MNIYGFDDYDRYHSLKMSSALWFWVVYSMRHGLLLLGLSMSSFSHSIEWMDDFTNETHWAYFLCGIPGTLLLIAIINRTPKAVRVMRWIWRNGRNLLVASLALHLIVSMSLAVTNQKWQLPVSQTIFFLFDAIGFIYLYKSQRVKDVFADFPPAEPNGNTGKPE